MSKIVKKMKIMQPGGTLSDYIPLGADASDVKTEDGMSVENKLKQKPYYFNNIAEMKSANLKSGDCVITLGYYEVNDGGAGTYQIVDEDLIDDGGSAHELNNNLFAKLIIENNTINVKQFGAKGDNSTDDTLSIQTAINTEKSVYVPQGTYLVTSLNCNNKKITIFGDARSTTTIKEKSSAVETLIDAYNNSYGFVIKNITIDGSNKVVNGIQAGNRNISFSSKNKMLLENISVINCTGTGVYMGNTSGVCNNINVVFCHDGVVFEGFGAVLTNSTVSQCEDYGVKLYQGNGYISNNKIYLNGNGIYCHGYVFSVTNNNIQQNKNNGIVLNTTANGNTFNNNILLANGYYADNTTPPTNNYEIILAGNNNSFKDCTIIPFTATWSSKIKACIENKLGFNNNVNITLGRALYTNNGLTTIKDINSYMDVDGYNIGNIIDINEQNINVEPTIPTITSSSAIGENITYTISDNIHKVIVSNVTFNEWDENNLSNLTGIGTRFTPSKQENVNGIYIKFDRELSSQFDKLGIGHYLQYAPTGGNLTPVNGATWIKRTFNPMTKKETLLLYVLFDEPKNINYFQIATRFVSYNNISTTVTELTATISNIEYYVF